MIKNWDFVIYFCVLISAAVGLVAWVIVYESKEWRSTLAWFKSVIRPKHATPIYGMADPYHRTNGPGAKPNLRVVRP